MRIFRAGVIGVGFIGVAHIEALRRLGNVEVVALTTKSDSAAKAVELNVPYSFTDYREMIDTMELDMVHICTPNNTHYEIAMYAMEHGVHVLCEKPMTATVEEARMLTAKAQEKGLVNAVNFHNRFYPITHHLRHLIKEGHLGSIFSIHGGYIQDWLQYETDFSWRLISSISGKTRTVADIGSHWLDLVEYMTSLRIAEVFADLNTIHKTRKRPSAPLKTFSKVKPSQETYENVKIDTEDIACILLRFDNGAVGNATFTQMFSGEKNRISVFLGGSEMSAQWDSNDVNRLLLGRRNDANLVLVKDPALLDPESKVMASYPGGHTEGFPDAFKQVFRQVYASIEDSSAAKDYATFEDGLRQMLLCDKIYESAKLGQWMKI